MKVPASVFSLSTPDLLDVRQDAIELGLVGQQHTEGFQSKQRSQEVAARLRLAMYSIRYGGGSRLRIRKPFEMVVPRP